jgi:hypothetical protein
MLMLPCPPLSSDRYSRDKASKADSAVGDVSQLSFAHMARLTGWFRPAIVIYPARLPRVNAPPRIRRGSRDGGATGSKMDTINDARTNTSGISTSLSDCC